MGTSSSSTTVSSLLLKTAYRCPVLPSQAPYKKASGRSGRTGPPEVPSRAASPITHIHLRSSAQSLSAIMKAPNPSTPAPLETPSFDIAGEERVLQDIVDKVLAQGVWITRARRLRGQELVEARPRICLAVTAALLRKECERTAAVTKLLAKRK